MTSVPQEPHFPRPAEIDSYGRGGFRFAGMSHRGSLLCLPSGIWAWDVRAADQLDEAAFARLFAEAGEIGLFILGTGVSRVILPDTLRLRFHAMKINVDVMSTGQAANTYNILLGERRRVAAGLIVVE